MLRESEGVLTNVEKTIDSCTPHLLLVQLIVSGDATKPSNSPEPLPGEPEPVFCDSEVCKYSLSPVCEEIATELV